MKKFNVFLSSAMNGELDQERILLRFGFQEDLILSEFYDLFAIEDHASSRTIQKAYVEEVINSDLIIFLFCKELRDAVLEEYNTALANDKKFIIYLKNVDDVDSNLSDFIKKEIYKYNPGSFFDPTNLFSKIKEDLKDDIARSYSKELKSIGNKEKDFIKLPASSPKSIYRYFTIDELIRLSKQPDISELSIDQLIALSTLLVEENGNFKGALALLELVLNKDSKNWMAHNNRGLILDSMGLYESSIFSYRKAIEHNPTSDSAYYNLGQSYFKLGNYTKAIDYYKKSLELQPEKENVITQITASFIRLDNAEESLLWAEKAYSLTKNDNTITNLISANLMNGKYDIAQELFGAISEKNPVYKRLNAFILYKSLKYNESIEIINEINSEGLLEYESALTKFYCLVELRKEEDAFEWLCEVEKIFPINPATYNNLAYQFIERFGKSSFATILLKKAVEEDPYLMIAWNNLQYNYAQLNDFENGMIACDEALKINPYDQKSIQNKARLLAETFQFTELMKLYMSKTTGVIGYKTDDNQLNTIIDEAFKKSGLDVQKFEESMKYLFEIGKLLNKDG
ncbi:MAG: tetratricopeptide repeat protein [Ignavibacteria bacterium]|jgi:tetratricopeptide (TPR) repeat protein